MTAMRFRTVAGSVTVALLVAAGCTPQTSATAETPLIVPPPLQQAAADPAPSQQPSSPQQLEQLVAPIALYADPLLSDILTAATYPLEIVEAERWLQDPGNAALKGDALTQALDGQNWDPSVKSLVPFPPILAMMDGHLDWTQRLGEAFLAQEADVMDAVQRLRQRAVAAGTLKSAPQESVTDDGGAVVIAPVAADMVYVPTYDPWCVYGPWAYPDYPPYYFGPWSGFCGPADYLIGYDFGLAWPYPWWWWGYPDWHHHHIHVHHDRWDHFHPGHGPGHGPGDDFWHHDPGHRRGVQYRDPRNAAQFQPGRDYHNAFRGYVGRGGEAVPPVHAAPPAFESFGGGASVRAESARGLSSRQSMPGGSSGHPVGGAPGGGVGGGGFGGHAGGGGGGGGRR